MQSSIDFPTLRADGSAGEAPIGAPRAAPGWRVIGRAFCAALIGTCSSVAGIGALALQVEFPGERLGETRSFGVVVEGEAPLAEAEVGVDLLQAAVSHLPLGRGGAGQDGYVNAARPSVVPGEVAAARVGRVVCVAPLCRRDRTSASVTPQLSSGWLTGDAGSGRVLAVLEAAASIDGEASSYPDLQAARSPGDVSETRARLRHRHARVIGP